MKYRVYTPSGHFMTEFEIPWKDGVSDKDKEFWLELRLRKLLGNGWNNVVVKPEN